MHSRRSMTAEYSIEDLISIWEKFFRKKAYKGQIADVERDYPEKKSITVSYKDILAYNIDFADNLLNYPNNVIYAGGEVLKRKTGLDIHLRIKELMQEVSKIDIRDLRAVHLGKFIAIEGLVRKATEVRPKLQDATFQCVRCGAILKVPQDELSFKEPLECSKDEGGCGRTASSTHFKLLTEDSKFIDTQILEIQESPEGLRGGDQPQRLTAYAEDDLTGRISPGDRVVLNGILKSRQRGKYPTKSTIFDIFLEVNSIEIEDVEFEDVVITPEEEEEILKMSKDPGIYEKITSSIAPTIYGMDVEKEGLVLQLFGGISKVMPDETRIRGDIHLLLVGDPGTAKSQLLRYIANLAPRGIYASGKSTSAAGLTAAAVRDEFGEGRWTLEAGALVLADKGVACIDELDKMSPQDRSSMHEAMEQQTISIAKAGITATLQSRCALLGAANPKFGRFDEFKPIGEQIDMPPALLSRFDLIFSITDKPDSRKDRELADHILRVHQAGEIDRYRGEIRNDKYSEEEEATAMRSVEPEISPELLRKYIAYAKRSVFPVLTKDAIDRIKDYYVNLRKEGEEENAPVPITARQLEAFVRLAEASARVRLSDEATIEDADRAIKIIEYCLRRVGTDWETGKFDIDMIATGTTHTQRDRIKIITEIIKELSREYPDGVPLEEIISQAENMGIEEDKVEYVIHRLNVRGDLFEPRAGKFRLARP